jgi:hypothetical protein
MMTLNGYACKSSPPRRSNHHTRSVITFWSNHPFRSCRRLAGSRWQHMKDRKDYCQRGVYQECQGVGMTLETISIVLIQRHVPTNTAQHWTNPQRNLGCLMTFKWPRQTKPADVSWFQKQVRAHLHIDAQKSSLARQI